MDRFLLLHLYHYLNVYVVVEISNAGSHIAQNLLHKDAREPFSNWREWLALPSPYASVNVSPPPGGGGELDKPDFPLSKSPPQGHLRLSNSPPPRHPLPVLTLYSSTKYIELPAPRAFISCLLWTFLRPIPKFTLNCILRSANSSYRPL